MTSESVQVAAVIDRYPPQARRRLRDALLRIASVIDANDGPPPPSSRQAPNVIELHCRPHPPRQTASAK
jgi:hypothetical protein